MTLEQLIGEAEQLPLTERWRLVNRVLQSLEKVQFEDTPEQDWYTFLKETFGSLAQTPIQRWDT